MKVISSTEANGFKPVTVMITLETEEEFNNFYQLANYGSRVATMVADYTGASKESLAGILEAVWDTLRAYK